jgi:carbon storage regulator
VIIDLGNGEEAVVRVLGIHGSEVQLGISAPRHVAVHRRELRDRIAAENRRAESEGEGGS